MDPVTTAIAAALAVGVANGVSQVSQKVIADAYNALKVALEHKFGADSDLVEAVDSLEEKPVSAGRRETLKEEVAAFNADQDPEILKAAQDLLDLIKSQSSGEQHIQTAIGSYIAQAEGGGTATVSINQPEE